MYALLSIADIIFLADNFNLLVLRRADHKYALPTPPNIAPIRKYLLIGKQNKLPTTRAPEAPSAIRYTIIYLSNTAMVARVDNPVAFCKVLPMQPEYSCMGNTQIKVTRSPRLTYPATSRGLGCIPRRQNNLRPRGAAALRRFAAWSAYSVVEKLY